MRRHFIGQGAVPIRLKWVVLCWLAAELVVFVLLVRTIGFGGTVLLGLATTLIGILTMRRLGTATLTSLRGALDGRQPPPDTVLDGMLGGLGALLLIIPGFLANLVGLALAAPSVRRKAMTLFVAGQGTLDQRRRKASPDVIDLGPADWRAVDHS